MADQVSLALDEWREILGYNPYHFWQQANETTPNLRITSSCNSLVQEFAWQNSDAVGRSEIRAAIETAANKLKDYLNFRIAPQYVEKILPYPRPYDGRMEYSRPVGGDGRWLSINVEEGFIQAIGLPIRTLIATPSVVYSDEDGDGVEDTFTITTATSVTDISQIAVYFNAADRILSAPVDEKWRIQPVTVTISAGIVTITGPSWILVRPIRLRGVASTTIDPTDVSLVTNNFAQTLDVFRFFTDPTGSTTDTSQAVLVWESDPPPWAVPCNGNISSLVFDSNRFDPAAIAIVVARANIRNARTGEITVGQAVLNADTGEFTGVNWSSWKQPDRVIIRYLAGVTANELDSQITLQAQWKVVLARLAMAELARRICACNDANMELFRWQFDRAVAAGPDTITNISEQDLNNPFGTREGHIYAWKAVKHLQLTKAVAV